MNDSYPKFHVFGPKGWINDPNGLIFYKGKYHVFYQFYPNDVHWGPMHWGHALSSDLRHWDYLEPALSPDAQDDGCFSGSAIEVNGLLYLIYTSFTNRDGLIRQQQAIAVSSDGIHFEKRGLIITSDDLPEGYAKEDFRDPSVVKDGDHYSMYVASRKLDGRGRILVFTSKDLFHWEFKKDLFGDDCLGTMIECPDRIGNILTFSEQFFPYGVDGNANIHGSRYILADENGDFLYKNAKVLDYGFDFYAAQTFKNKRVLLGWLSMWDRSHNSESLGYAGELTYPRVLNVKNGELYQTPYFDESDRFTPLNLKGNNVIKCQTGIIHLLVEGLKELNIKFSKGKDMFASLSLSGDELIFDRSKAEQVTFKETDPDSLAKVRKMSFDSSAKSHELYFVLDNHSVEIFVDGKVLSSLLDTDDKEGTTEINVKAEELKGEIAKL